MCLGSTSLSMGKCHVLLYSMWVVWAWSQTQCGRYCQCVRPQDKETGFSRGFGVIKVDSWNAANIILEKDWHLIGRSSVSPVFLNSRADLHWSWVFLLRTLCIYTVILGWVGFIAGGGYLSSSWVAGHQSKFYQLAQGYNPISLPLGDCVN